MRSTNVSITVFDKKRAKRHRVTLRVPSDEKRDKRQTGTATCANFLHQKDASIAFQVIGKLKKRKAPIYTVHENFLTTSLYVPDIYTRVYVEMGPPLRIRKTFLYENLIKPNFP